MSEEKDKWDGKNFPFIRFDMKVKAELLKKGGKSLLKHWDGSYSSARLRRFIMGTFDLNADEEYEDSNLMSSVDYPDQWVAFVRSYFPGPFDPNNVQKDTRPKIRHFRIQAMIELVAAREAQTWEVVHGMMKEKCNPRTECRQLVEHQGSAIRALMRANHGEHESEEIRSLKAAFNRGDVHQHGTNRPGNMLNSYHRHHTDFQRCHYPKVRRWMMKSLTTILKRRSIYHTSESYAALASWHT